MYKILFSAILIPTLIACSGIGEDDPSRRVNTPVFNPTNTSFTEPITVRIDCELLNARIFYTLDESLPTNYSKHYKGPFTISKTTTVKAVAILIGYRESEVATITYSYNKVNDPVFDLEEGIYYEYQEISLSCPTTSAEIYYTLGGTEPFLHPALLYEETFTIPYNIENITTIKAKAFRTDWVPSNTVTKRYEFRIPRMILVQGGSLKPSFGYSAIVYDYYISNYQITQEQYQVIMEGNNNDIDSEPSFNAGNIHNPVENVTWYEALVYCNRRSIDEALQPVYAKGGSFSTDTWGAVPIAPDPAWDSITQDITRNGYRLPTEVEWLFAAKGGNLSINYPYAGSNHAESVAWILSNSENTTHRIGDKIPNEIGLYDMSGNVWEWCWDWYAGDFPVGTIVNPTGPDTGDYRVQKGGSYLHYENNAKTEHRGRANPYYRKEDHGFRVVRMGNL
jgi:hypothetical protein